MSAIVDLPRYDQSERGAVVSDCRCIQIGHCDNISGSTAAWGLEVQRFEMKDVELPQAMQQRYLLIS